MGEAWHIYNRETGERFDKLEGEDLNARIHQLLTHCAVEIIYAWKPGFKDWSPISEVPELKAIVDAQAAQEDLPPPPPMPLSATKESEEIDWKERRKSPRLDARLKLVLVTGQDSFRTFTHNISTGGLAVGHGIPDKFLNIPCEAFISSPDAGERVKVVARAIASSSKTTRLVFDEASREAIDKLNVWMKEAATREESASAA